MRKFTTRLTGLAALAVGVLLVSAPVISNGAAAERGRDGHVSIIYWQAPSILNPYLSGGTKDLEAASMILEPLARFDASGNLTPWLAVSVPTVANGGVSADLRTVTWKLREGLLWSDGSPVTAADVVFTAEYCRDPAGGCAQLAKFDDVTKVEALDDLTVKITFGVPKPYPYGPFVAATSPILQKAQFAACKGARAPECTEANFGPVGTGPFRVTEFRPNDVISLEANPNYRDPAKPAFATVTFKGGGDAAAAGRAVLATGEFDYAWNLQLAPEVLKGMQAAGKGTTVSSFGTLVERLVVNMTDPSPERGEARSTRAHPHPFLSDRAVRKALSMAIDRRLLVEIGYGQAGRPTCNVVPAPGIYASKANDDCLRQDIEGAKRLLDQAGWRPGADGVRQKDGVRLSILYQTSTNAVRQDFQALIKQWWSEIGVETELRNIDASVFFGGDPGSPDTYQKFFADIEMYANNFEGADPEPYLASWRCGNEPRPATQWQGENMPRYCSEAYDRLIAEMAMTGDISERARLAKAMNDLLVQDYALIPLVHRGRVSAHARSLGGVRLNTWDSEIWNIADWHRAR
ncbi:MAG: peptide ABC transporter substrate-binding protein [Rhodospirillales bacterium]|nr:peptide ABC transporter substrate-binding protein [Rhodospirillales bacterium]